MPSSYANYLKFIERGRSEFLRELGFEQEQLIHNQSIIFAVKSLDAEYLSPAKFNDLLIVDTEIEKSRHAGLIFLQRIMASEQNKVLFISANNRGLWIQLILNLAPFLVKFWRK